MIRSKEKRSGAAVCTNAYATAVNVKSNEAPSTRLDRALCLLCRDIWFSNNPNCQPSTKTKRERRLEPTRSAGASLLGKIKPFIEDSQSRGQSESDNRSRKVDEGLPHHGCSCSQRLAARYRAASDQKLSDFAFGYFGASAGAAAALVAAAQRPTLLMPSFHVAAVRISLERRSAKAPLQRSLMIGEFDRDVIELNRQAAKAMRAITEIRIVPGATHLFEEPGALEQVASLARTSMGAGIKVLAPCHVHLVTLRAAP